MSEASYKVVMVIEGEVDTYASGCTFAEAHRLADGIREAGLFAQVIEE